MQDPTETVGEGEDPIGQLIPVPCCPAKGAQGEGVVVLGKGSGSPHTLDLGAST